MKIVRKVLSCVLVFAMMLSCVGISAYAAPADDLTTDNFSLEISEADSTLSIALVCDKAVSAWGGSVGFMSITDSTGVDASAYFTLNSINNEFGESNNDLTQKKWSASANDFDNGDSLESGTWTTYVYTVSSEIPDGKYTFIMDFAEGECFEATNMEDYSIGGQSISTTYTAGEVIDGYTAQVTAPAEVTAGTDFVVNVGVDHNEDDTFHAAEIVLEYDPAVLTLKNISETQNLKYTNANGVLTVENFDEEHTMGTGVYTFTFTANANAGNSDTTVALTSAKFLDKAAASSSDLIDATKIDPEEATVKINEVVYKVSPTDDSDTTGLNYKTEVTKGESLIITAVNPNLYVYSIKATIGGEDITVSDDGNGTFTIPAASITGDIVLETSRTERTYSVEVKDDPNSLVGLPADAPKYNTDYIFTIPEDQPPTTTSVGYTYSATVTVNGVDYDAEKDGLEYKIPGAAVVGDIVITLVTVEEPATPIPQVTVEVSGSTDVKVNGQDKVTVDEGTIVTLTLTKETGYDYIVKVGDLDITETIVANGTYGLQANATVTVSVEKKLITDNLVTVYEYLTLNSEAGEKLWLVTFNPTLADGKIPTYESAAMFQSEKYDAYCYLVKEKALDAETAAKKLGTVEATAESVLYDGNVNKTAIIDAADAQFVANMYNATYAGTDSTVTMPMFLSADMNSDHLVDILDAEAIVKQILKIS